MKGISHSGQRSLKVSNEKGGPTSIHATQWMKVQPGRRYEFSAWAKCDEKCEGGIALLTALFGGPGHRLDVPPRRSDPDGNKLQTYIGARPPWVRMRCASSLTAPGIGSATSTLHRSRLWEPAVYDNAEFKEAPEGAPVEIVFGGRREEIIPLHGGRDDV